MKIWLIDKWVRELISRNPDSGITLYILVTGLIVRRPFCKYVCPLGAIYGFFNKISIYRMTHNTNKCIHCGACAKACHMNLDPSKTPNSMECIRCGECIDVCPVKALHLGIKQERKGSPESDHVR